MISTTLSLLYIKDVFLSMQLSLLFSFFLFYSACFAQIPNFPGAQGFGAFTVGGRGGKVIKVTSLEDSGPGTLREALTTAGPRIIVFTTGGIINLKTKLTIRDPFVTIAGQTAPGNGICLRGEGVRVSTHDVVIRYLRIRPGEIDFGPVNKWDALDAITIGDTNQGSVQYIN